MLKINIVNLGYDSTHYSLIADKKPRLLFDAGWPNSLPKLEAQAKRNSVKLGEIPYMLISHYHPDHAGLAQELKNMGIKLIVLKNQVEALSNLKTFIKPNIPYLEIESKDNILLEYHESRAFLAKIGLEGEIIATAGHSDDSLSLVLDAGLAFTGDLPYMPNFNQEPESEFAKSWQKILAFKPKTIYPAHGPMKSLE